MVLHTQLVEGGMRIAVTATRMDAPAWHTFPVPSETFLQVIQETVAREGGWQTVTDWVADPAGSSFTSLRGLITLVNTLAPLHGVTLWTIENGSVVPAPWPMHPSYHMEPNISKRSTVIGVDTLRA